MKDEIEARLEDLETLNAHQSRTIEELNELVFQQGKEIRALKSKLSGLAASFNEVAELVGNAMPNEKPPHW
ncbi:MAG: SlyX family protein [Pseudomonadota bacterium]